MLSVFDHRTQCHWKHFFFWGFISSTHSVWLHHSLRDNHFGPISQRNRVYMLKHHDRLARTPLPKRQTYAVHTQTWVSFMMQTKAEITGFFVGVFGNTRHKGEAIEKDKVGGMEHTHIEEKHHQSGEKPTFWLGLFLETRCPLHHTPKLSKWHGLTPYYAAHQATHSQGLLCVFGNLWSYLCDQLLCSSRHCLQKGKED